MTDTEICNMAIGRLGISIFIANLATEQSNEARVCRVFFGTVRDRVLEDFPWSFAKRTKELQNVGAPPAPWAYRYRYPNDCVFARSVEMTGAGAPLKPIPFEKVEDEAAGGLAILTTVLPATLVYTARITNTALYPAQFINALAWALASDIAAPLSAAPNMADKAASAYAATLLKAGAQDLNERQEKPEPESDFITARF